MGRPASCHCGECAKCKMRIAAREAYQALSLAERRSIVAARDAERVRAADRARYRRDKKKRREAMDAYARANPKRIYSIGNAWRKRNPEKVAAHGAVARAIKKGTLVRKPCEVCGATKVHAHHDDYSKPLEVRWLCPEHHAVERSLMRTRRSSL